MKPLRAVGTVLFASEVSSVTDRNSSFQQLTKLKMNAATMPGVMTGTRMRKSAPMRLQPSIMAASSSASGTFSKKPRSMIVENGMHMAMYTKTSPVRSFTSPSETMSW
jgi:hypothetical protein